MNIKFSLLGWLFLLFIGLTTLNAQNAGPTFEKYLDLTMPVVSGEVQQKATIDVIITRANGNMIVGINKKLAAYSTGSIPKGIMALAELSPQGDTIWVQHFQRNYQTSTDLFVDYIKELPNNNLIVTGLVTEMYVHSGFIWLMDPNGNILIRKNLEARAFPNNQYSYLPLRFNDIIQGSDGSFYFAGNYGDLYSGGSSFYQWTIATYGKLNSDLTPAWGRIYNENVTHSQTNLNESNILGLTFLPSGNIRLLGRYAESIAHLNIADVDISGNLINNRRIQIQASEHLISAVTTPNFDSYLLTQYKPTTNTQSFSLIKINQNGNIVWTKLIGNAGIINGKRLRFDVNTNSLLVVGSVGAAALFAQFDTSGFLVQSKKFNPDNVTEYFADVTNNGGNFVLVGSNSVQGGYMVQADLQGMTTCTTVSEEQSLTLTARNLVYGTGPVQHKVTLFRDQYAASYLLKFPFAPLVENVLCYACSDKIYNTYINACDSYFIDGAMQYASNTFTETYPSSEAGCDSIINTHLTIYQTPTNIDAGIDQSVCGSVATLSAQAPSAGQGVWSVIQGSGTFANVNSPTSQVTNIGLGVNVFRWTVNNGPCASAFDELTIVRNQNSSATQTITNCGPFTWINGITYTSSNQTATHVIPNSLGCDSIITLNLTIRQASTAIDVKSACNSYTWIDGNTYTSSNNTATYTIPNAAGCDSIITLNLSVYYPTASSVSMTTCDSYSLNGQTYTSSGTYTQHLTNSRGCDSTLTLNLIILNSTTSTQTATACDAYSLNGYNYSQSGVYTQILSNSNGCDSTLTLNLTIHSSKSSTSSVTACDSYSINGQTYTSSGLYTQNLFTSNGCDSTVLLNVQIKNSTSSVLNVSACNSYSLNGQSYTSSGTYTQLLSNSNGCDSTITLHLQIKQSTSSTQTVSACNSYTLNGQTYTSSGTYTQMLTNAMGCDSLLTLHLTIRQNTSSSINVSACGGYTLNGQTYIASGNYVQLFTNAQGCDSVLTLNLTIKNATTSTLTASSCGSYNLNGYFYTTSGTYTQNLTNVAGCDSTLTLNLTIKNATTSTLTASACNAYSLNGQTYTSSGTYTQNLINAAGCDSTLTLNLTIKNATTSTLTASACYSYLLNGQTYTSSGTYTQNLTNVAGCDSTLTLHLTIKNATSSSLTASACDSYLLNGQTYTSSGIYTQNLINVAGCDSTLTLHLTIKNASSETLNVSACGSYNYNGQTYMNSGTYTHILTNHLGCDSTITLNLVVNPIEVIQLSASSCDSYVFNGQTYTTSGTYTQFFTSSFGCDSTVVLNLVVNPSLTSQMTVTSCGAYLLNGQVYTSSGTYTQNHTSALGCDSILTLHLTVNQVNTNVTQNGIILTAQASGAQFQWINCVNGNILPGETSSVLASDENGTFAVVVTQNGCKDTSTCYTVSTIGVEEVDNTFSFEVYPNPSNEWVNIKTSATGSAIIQLYDISGRLIQVYTMPDASAMTLDVHPLIPGIYILRLHVGEGSHVVRIIRN